MALSAYAIEQHVALPHNNGPLEDARYGVSGIPHEGPWIEIWLKVSGERILDAAYRTYGCPSSIACGSLLCDLVRGRSVAQARLIEPSDLLVVLGGLPDGKGFLAAYAIDAMVDALEEGA